VKAYIPSVAAGLLLLAVTPFMLFLIFFSGDSCCNEDTSETVRAVTAAVVFVLFVASAAINSVILLIRGKKRNFSFLPGVTLTWVISSSIYPVFTKMLVLSAFGFRW
jgi:hypothetical protein